MERKMKNQSENVWAAAQLSYEAPCVDVINVQVEKGFAQSDITPGDNSASSFGDGGSL
jgi:hypothetical protein